MSAAVKVKNSSCAPQQIMARVAGALFLLLVLTAAFTEFFAGGKLSLAADLTAGIIEVSCMVAVTLLLYGVLRSVSVRLAILAALCNFVALTLELLQYLPHGVNIGLGLHGFYWVLIGYLFFKSTYLPGIVGALLAIAGLCWLTFLSPPLAIHLSPYNLAFALLVEGVAMLWLLVMGVNAQQSQVQASARHVDPT